MIANDKVHISVVAEGIQYIKEYRGYKVIVSCNSILVVDLENKPFRYYKNLEIVSALFVDECYLYCILKDNQKPIEYSYQ